MCGFLPKIVHEKGIFLLKNQQQKIGHSFIGVGSAKTKKSSNPPYFQGGLAFLLNSGAGIFQNCSPSKGI